MITKLTIKNKATFDKIGQTTEKIEDVNFTFCSNGTGKTTLGEDLLGRSKNLENLPKEERKRKHWIITEKNNVEIIKDWSGNPISNNYRNLWLSIRQLNNHVAVEGGSFFNLQNSIRKIFEHFFDFYYGLVTIKSINKKLLLLIKSKEEMNAVRSLLDWANDDYHSRHSDEFDYSPDIQGGAETHLKIFKIIFEKSDKLDRCDMMMGNKIRASEKTI